MAGKLLGYVLRFDQPDGSKEFLPATYCENTATGAREWRFEAWLPPRPLYGLDRLAQHPTAPVIVCEGEKAADAGAELLPDHAAVTSPNGAKSATKADWRVLAGRDVTLWPDNDPDNDNEGRDFAAAVARALRGVAAVEVTPQGWHLIECAPVKFVCSSAMRPLPIPEAGGMIEQELRDLVNVRGETDFKLIVAWLVACFNPRGPYPILAVSGEQGTAKSTLCRLLRKLVDPNEAPDRAPPRDEHGLIVAALNCWVVTFDNVSDIPPWLSDGLRRLATGSGLSTRHLYGHRRDRRQG